MATSASDAPRGAPPRLLLGDKGGNGCCGLQLPSWLRSKAAKLVASSLCVVLGGVGQAVFMPLLIGALGQAAGSYVVFVLLCITFVIVFAMATLFQYLSGGLRTADLAVNDGTFALIGLCDCLNGLLTVFCSALDRTPGALQAVLPQLAIPFTVLLSFGLYRVSLSRQQSLGALLVVLGVLATMVPTFAAMASGGSAAYSPLYPALFALGVVPGVLTNVLQTGIYRRHPGFNKTLFLLYRSSYQAIFAMAFFWSDLLPGLGTSATLGDMGSHIDFGVSCLFHPEPGSSRCGAASWLGLCFTLAYCATYWGGAVVIEAASANYVALLSTANTHLAAFVWFVAPALTAWAGGSPYSVAELGWGIGALVVLIVPGSLVYKLAKPPKAAAPRRESEVAAMERHMGGGLADAAAPLIGDGATDGPRADGGGEAGAAPSERPLLVDGLGSLTAGSGDLRGTDARIARLLALQRAIEIELDATATSSDDARFVVYVR